MRFPTWSQNTESQTNEDVRGELGVADINTGVATIFRGEGVVGQQENV
jgi:hypothetical protein